MKIDESCIGHNALRMIEDMVGTPMEYISEPDTCTGAVELGAVYGIICLAKELKEVLKA